MMTTVRWFLAVVVAVTGLCLLAESAGEARQAAAPPPISQLVPAIDAHFQKFMQDAHVPGLTYGIVRGGKVEHIGVMGVQDLDAKRPVNADTLFRIASMSKAFTALAILKLRDDGKLSLDAPAETYIPEMRGWKYATTDSPPIRVRDLLSHTGGFVTDDPWGDRQQVLPEEDFTRMIRSGVPFTRAPGMVYEYSNFGYALLGRIVTNVSGKPFKDYIEQGIMRPLGMNDTGYDIHASPLPRRAIGYRWENEAFAREPDMIHGSFGAMGGVQTSANEYAKWVTFLLSAWPPRDGAETGPAKRASVRELSQGLNFPGRVNRPGSSGPCVQAGTYGMGFRVAVDCDLGLTMGHGGGFPGYGSFLLLLPELDAGIFALSNRTYAGPTPPVWNAAMELFKAGWLKGRTIAVSTALADAYRAAGQMYGARRLDPGQSMLAMNFLMDRSAENWAATFERIYKEAGACKTDAPITATGALSGFYRWSCEMGTVAGNLLLAPTNPPTIQSFGISIVASAQGKPQQSEWRYFGGDKAFTRYSALDQINRDNVAGLRIAWRRPAVNAKLIAAFPDTRPNAYLRSTPIVVDGVLYTQDAHGLVMALNGETGQTIWEQPFGAAREDAVGASTRGVDYWRGGTGNTERRILAIRGEYLYALDAATGRPVTTFGIDGRVTLRFTDRQPLAGRFNDSTGPLVVGNVVVVTGNTAGAGDGGNRKEAAPEDVRGFDVQTGRHLWTFHVVPRPGEFGHETWGNDSWKIAGDLGAWNPMTADEELGYVYIPLSSPTAAWYGGWRPGDNLFANSLVALDVKTGQRVWHFQTVHHDLWDWDNIGPPLLGEITVDGRRIRAVMQANKAAFLYVLDRTNGRPVWPIEERPVPQSTVPGERSSPTQPFPTKPPAFDLQGISDADLIDYTPALKERARTIAKQYVMGPVFTPPSVPSDQTGGTKGTLVQPGAWGSANWNTGAFDPETGYYYAVSQTLGPANRAARKQAGDPRATMEYADFEPTVESANQAASQAPPSTVDAINIDGLPIIKGPYGRVTAIDLNRGVHVWMKPNGDGPRHHPLLKDLNLPPLGYPNRPAPLLTKTLLFLGEGSDAISGTAGADWTWGRKFRAYDKATGSVIWEMNLPSGTTAGPMTYMVNGKQFIVVSIGSRDHPPEYVALSLPK